ncbi:AraC family transcriptional regulator [Paenibacillus ginsengihumi]|uniref:AraC family transcriptional regulator n=1 Tax=Paenibacillus ginsengihumi TaxID=431596 RepID=UPI00037368F7|nr:AraC family transcriptional regulator [Paenibacillus ginsengihumi]
MKRQRLLPTISDHPYLVLPESVGWYWDEPDHSVYRPEHSLNNFNIHYVVSGRGYVEYEQKIFELKEGDAVLYFPLQEQRYYSSADDPWSVRWVHFYGKALHEYMLERGFSRSPLWTLRQRKPFEQAMERLLAETEANGLLNLPVLSTLTYAVLAEFTAHAVPLTVTKNTDAVNRILQLLQSMQREACEPFDLSRWAAEAGVSSHYFCKLFKKTTQMSPMTFITLCRMQRAKQWLLEEKELTVREIAGKAGYPNVSYFNKRFLEQEGMTPTEYRQLYGRE